MLCQKERGQDESFLRAAEDHRAPFGASNLGRFGSLHISASSGPVLGHVAVGKQAGGPALPLLPDQDGQVHQDGPRGVQGGGSDGGRLLASGH